MDLVTQGEFTEVGTPQSRAPLRISTAGCHPKRHATAYGKLGVAPPSLSSVQLPLLFLHRRNSALTSSSLHSVLICNAVAPSTSDNCLCCGFRLGGLLLRGSVRDASFHPLRYARYANSVATLCFYPGGSGWEPIRSPAEPFQKWSATICGAGRQQSNCQRHERLMAGRRGLQGLRRAPGAPPVRNPAEPL